MRRTFLYRALSLEEVFDEYTDEVQIFIGDSLGRSSGYLSRSGAKRAGERFGGRFAIVRSEPIAFAASEEVDEAQRVALLAEAGPITPAMTFAHLGAFEVYSYLSSETGWERRAVFFKEVYAHDYAMDMAEAEGEPSPV